MMDKDKSQHGNGAAAGRYSAVEAGEQGGHFGHADSSRFSHDDISRMPDNPPKNNLGHRRAHSEILTLPDDISFDSDLGVVGGFDGPDDTEDLFSMYLVDMDKFNANATSSFQVGDSSSSAFNTPRIRHHHSHSMEEMLMSAPEDASKKAMSAAKLAELALIDPKRAKRIWANRQSAARSKERKMRYIAELERKVQALQTEATSLSAQLTLLQRDTNGLTTENGELKLRLQTTEQQVHLQDALNDALKEEIQHLKALTGQTIQNGGGSMMNFPASYGAGNSQYYASNQAMHTLLTAQQLQQLNLHSQKQQQHHFHQFQQQQLPPQPSMHQMQSSIQKDLTPDASLKD